MLESLIKSSSSIDDSRVLGGSQGKKKKRNIAPILMLTSLVDTFSVLVIFLLINFSSTGEMLYMSKGMELPAASKIENLLRNLVVKIDKGDFFVEEEKVENGKLTARLVELRKSWDEKYPGQDFTGALTIQADRRDHFDQISSIIQAAAHAGFSDIHFASIRK